MKPSPSAAPTTFSTSAITTSAAALSGTTRSPPPTAALVLHSAHPLTQVGANRIDAVEPYVLDRGSQPVVILRGDRCKLAFQRLVADRKVVGTQRERAGTAEHRQRLELDLVEERAAG